MKHSIELLASFAFLNVSELVYSDIHVRSYLASCSAGINQHSITDSFFLRIALVY